MKTTAIGEEVIALESSRKLDLKTPRPESGKRETPIRLRVGKLDCRAVRPGVSGSFRVPSSVQESLGLLWGARERRPHGSFRLGSVLVEPS